MKNLYNSIIGLIGKIILWMILKTCRIEVHGLHFFEEATKDGKSILALWHSRLLIIAEALHRATKKQTFAAIVSSSRDGHRLKSLVNSYSRGKTIRVSSKEPDAALRKMIKHLQDHDDILVITPDGPRGPKEKVKGGVIFAAQKSEASVIPLTWNADRSWTLPTWDGMLLPKPFSRVSIYFGKSLCYEEISSERLTDALNLRK